jgi:hypothetical protein
LSEICRVRHKHTKPKAKPIGKEKAMITNEQISEIDPYAQNVGFMFRNKTLPQGIILPSDFGSEAKRMDYMFYYATLHGGIALPKGFGRHATSTKYMLACATLGGDIDWSDTQFENLKSMDAKDMFYKTKFNGNRVIVANENIRQKFIEEGGAADEAVVVKGAENEQ